MDAESRAEQILEHPFTSVDLQLAGVMALLGLGASFYLRSRGELILMRAAMGGAAAAFLGGWLVHQDRLARLLELGPGAWTSLVPAALAAAVAASFADRSRWLKVAAFCGLGFGLLARLALFFLRGAGDAGA
ncbi:MAG: hypothetical protein HYZ28_28130 [Myxococcales bacterium]|nr:hypothetical protein [Myxococcales bacterium]